MQLEKSTAQLLKILRAFHSITEKIAEYEQDLEQLLRAILALFVPMLNVSHGSILLLDEKQSRFHTAVAYGDFPFALDFKAILDSSKLLQSSTAIGETQVFTDIVDDSEWNQLKPEVKRLLGKALCSPLVIEHKIIGVACVYGEGFNPGVLETELFSLCANLAALAIEKSDLYHQIHKRLGISHEELKRTQGQLIRSEKLRSLVEIAMSVAHTIRNPVTVIGGLSRRLNRSLSQDDSKHLLSEMILSEALRLEDIVKEFDRFFSIDQISFQHEDINQLLGEAADDFLSQWQTEPKLTLTQLLCKEPLICRVDPDLLNRCLTHLLANAREASRNGVHITLATSRKERDAIIDVTDSGKGISREEIDHVFDPFYSTKGYGAGMGLTFVHFVIKEHSGQIELKSEKGVGTRFRIRLPLESFQ